MDKSTYDLTIAKEIGFSIHVCSECNGTKEVTGHKHWCGKSKDENWEVKNI